MLEMRERAQLDALTGACLQMGSNSDDLDVKFLDAGSLVCLLSTSVLFVFSLREVFFEISQI